MMRPDRWLTLRRRLRRAASERARGLPTAIVILQMAVSSGASPRAAIEILAGLRLQPGPLHRVVDDFASIREALALGASLDDVMVSVAATMSASTQRVLDVLRRAEVDGSPLALHLDVLVHELRRERASELDLIAQRLTVSMLFPLVFCILPAFILLAIVPLLQTSLQGLPL